MKNNPNLSKLKQTIKEIIKELDDELDEHNMTGNVDGYNTPSAFTKTDGTDVDAETDDDYVKRLNKSTGYVKVNETKQGKRYGDWSVTQFVPLSYDDLGSVHGGIIKLVNQKTMDTLLIQHDNALRGG